LRLYPPILKLWSSVFHKPKYWEFKLCLHLRLYPLNNRLTQTVLCSSLHILLKLVWEFSLVTMKLLLGHLLNLFFWLKLWLLLRIFKFEVVSSYNILIKLTRTMFLLEFVYISYWVNVKTFGVTGKFFYGYQLYYDRYDFTDKIFIFR
jgi:hypothetical protein